ncbi:MAG TPA: flagellar motor switch protein FliG [Candidatus Brocadiia bacterium]|nr:flagellar motor switch protein FliG [Planctomycetota bacterium]MBI4007781.1 flagellar motor switch protein FliG [Planctomycetota bacterium]MDO8092227.1 flagellar motor switch protein FliG [Candidatus Brocadiales bacterium]
MKALSGKQKVAILLSTLDTDVAAQIIKNFDEVEIAHISAEIGRLESIDEGTIREVLDEFSEEANSSPAFRTDFSDSFKKLLERTLGLKKAEEILKGTIEGDSILMPFQTLKELNTDTLFNILSTEHPQTITLTLSYLEPAQASEVLTKFPVELQADVLMRIASMDLPSTKLLMQVNEIIESKVKHTEVDTQKITREQRLKTVAEIMGMTDVNTEKAIIDIIAQKEPETAEEIRKLSFVFEDIVLVHDQALRKVLSELDNRVVAMALKTASEGIVKKVFSNMSQRVGQSVREEWELLGPRPLSEVEEAQQQVVDAIKNLEAKGEKVIKRKGSKAEQLV